MGGSRNIHLAAGVAALRAYLPARATEFPGLRKEGQTGERDAHHGSADGSRSARVDGFSDVAEQHSAAQIPEADQIRRHSADATRTVTAEDATLFRRTFAEVFQISVFASRLAPETINRISTARRKFTSLMRR